MSVQCPRCESVRIGFSLWKALPEFATATPATLATVRSSLIFGVANVAVVAVANSLRATCPLIRLASL